MPPRVTVSIPTRNRADLLRGCIKSVLDQSLSDIEVFVSDNASSDDTADVVAAFDDPRLHYAPLTRDVGLHGNLTRCLRLGSAPYVVVLSDDDELLPHALARSAAMLDAHPTVALVHGAYRRVVGAGDPSPTVLTNANLGADTVEDGFDFVWRTLQQGARVCNPTVMLRRSVVLDQRFDPADGPYCDNALWLRIARTHDVGYVAEPLAAYRVHTSSQTSAFKLRRTRRGKAILTPYHATATLLANTRFLERAGYDAATTRRLRRLVRRHDRVSRLGIRLHVWLPAPLVRRLKRGLSRLELEHGARWLRASLRR